MCVGATYQQHQKHHQHHQKHHQQQQQQQQHQKQQQQQEQQQQKQQQHLPLWCVHCCCWATTSSLWKQHRISNKSNAESIA